MLETFIDINRSTLQGRIVEIKPVKKFNQYVKIRYAWKNDILQEDTQYVIYIQEMGDQSDMITEIMTTCNVL